MERSEVAALYAEAMHRLRTWLWVAAVLVLVAALSLIVGGTTGRYVAVGAGSSLTFVVIVREVSRMQSRHGPTSPHED